MARQLQQEINPGQPPRRLDIDASLDEDWAFDSLSRAELFLRLERALGVSLREHLLAEAKTLRELQNAVALAPAPVTASTKIPWLGNFHRQAVGRVSHP